MALIGHFFSLYEVDEKQAAAMVDAARDAVAGASEVKHEQQHEYQLRAVEVGDNVVLWTVYYYTKDIRNLLVIR